MESPWADAWLRFCRSLGCCTHDLLHRLAGPLLRLQLVVAVLDKFPDAWTELRLTRWTLPHIVVC